MTVKQLRLIKHLGDKDCPSVKVAGERAGYSYTAKNIYAKPLKATIQKTIGSDPKAIIEAYEDLIRRCKLKEDLSNERGVLDSLCRINAMFKDKHEINVMQSLPPEKITPELINEAKQALEVIT